MDQNLKKNLTQFDFVFYDHFFRFLKLINWFIGVLIVFLKLKWVTKWVFRDKMILP